WGSALSWAAERHKGRFKCRAPSTIPDRGVSSLALRSILVPFPMRTCRQEVGASYGPEGMNFAKVPPGTLLHLQIHQNRTGTYRIVWAQIARSWAAAGVCEIGVRGHPRQRPEPHGEASSRDGRPDDCRGLQGAGL